MLKSAIASPTWRRMRLASLSVSSFCFLESFCIKKTIYRKTDLPPSTARTWPVTKGAVARKCTARAISSGAPSRSSGVVATTRARSSRRELSVFGPGDRAGRDRVDAHLRPELQRQRARHRDKTRLGDAVDRIALQRPLGVDVGDVHDRAALLPDGRRRLLREEQRRAQVGADQLIPVAGLDRPDGGGVEGRRVVDQHVEAAEALERRAEQKPGRDRREQVRLHLRRAAGARGIQFRFQRRGLGFGAAVMQHDVRAGRVQPARDRRADAPRGAGDESGFPLQVLRPCQRWILG